MSTGSCFIWFSISKGKPFLSTVHILFSISILYAWHFIFALSKNLSCFPKQSDRLWECQCAFERDACSDLYFLYDLPSVNPACDYPGATGPYNSCKTGKLYPVIRKLITITEGSATIIDSFLVLDRFYLWCWFFSLFLSSCFDI